jgi:hypothetical protein
MFERRHEKLAPLPVFIKRVAVSLALSICLILVVLSFGIAGYHWIAGFDWVDSLLEASMILGGMGPVNQLTTTGSKIFASGYALFSGLIFIAVVGVGLSPILHRMFHKFHLDEKDIEPPSKASRSKRN